MSILRHILRRKVRSAVTISGIAVGMFALVVLGAMSENMRVYMENATAYFKTVAMVMDARDAGVAGMPSGSWPLGPEKLAEVARQPGVAACLPMFSMLLDDNVITVGTSPPPMIMGFDARLAEVDKFWGMGTGRFFEPGERGVAVLGPDFAKQRRAKVGDSLEVRGVRMKVIGISARSGISLNDSSVYVPIEDSRDMYIESLPEAFRSSVKPEEVVFAGLAYPAKGHTAAEIARTIEKNVRGVKAMDQEKTLAQMDSYIGAFNAVLAALAALGLVIGGLTIVNTMSMAVSERTREVGVMRALGASRARIARDVLLESAALGALGGAGGVALGALAAAGLGGAVTASTGVNMFMLTWRLVVFALGFAVLIGTLAGLYPAVHAARMDPVAALAYE